MSNIGIGYMKNVFALAMQAVLMMICVAIDLDLTGVEFPDDLVSFAIEEAGLMVGAN